VKPVGAFAENGKTEVDFGSSKAGDGCHASKYDISCPLQ
jgi:hypothetical protein